MEVGDQLGLPGPEGEMMATVTDPAVGPDGESFSVQLENGKEEVVTYASFGCTYHR